MTERKWTPGPWALHMLPPEESMMGQEGEWNISAQEDDMLFGKTPYYPYVSDNIADAHLIAAAPDLYEALDNLLKCHEGEGGTKYHAGDIARAALAKARGERK